MEISAFTTSAKKAKSLENSVVQQEESVPLHFIQHNPMSQQLALTEFFMFLTPRLDNNTQRCI